MSYTAQTYLAIGIVVVVLSISVTVLALSGDVASFLSVAASSCVALAGCWHRLRLGQRKR